MSIQEALDKYRVETHSKIIPYVVRDHAWNFGHHDQTNFYRYKDDAPEGYKDAVTYRKPHPTNIPIPPKVIVDIKEKEEEEKKKKEELAKKAAGAAAAQADAKANATQVDSKANETLNQNEEKKPEEKKPEE
jgi:hypothetical protein